VNEERFWFNDVNAHSLASLAKLKHKSSIGNLAIAGFFSPCRITPRSLQILQELLSVTHPKNDGGIILDMDLQFVFFFFFWAQLMINNVLTSSFETIIKNLHGTRYTPV